MINQYSSKHSNFHARIIGFFIKNGKKTKVTKLLNSCFFEISRLLRKPFYLVLKKVFLFLNVYVETKSIKIRRSRYIVPFPINKNRRIYLAIKWLAASLKNKKQRVSFLKKLKLEILSILIDSRHSFSESIKLKQQNLLKAKDNRSYIHYRW
jgi:ribosomal protein S7